jgi:hypothetical protein
MRRSARQHQSGLHVQWPPLRPLLAAIRRAWRGCVATPTASSRAVTANWRPPPATLESRLHCEPLEPRLLLAGDLPIAADTLAATAVATERPNSGETRPAAARVVIATPAAGPGGAPAPASSDVADILLEADVNADGRGDLLQISPRGDGMAIARTWLASGSGFAGGEAVVLGPWLTGNRYLVGDIDGDGRSDLGEIRQASGSLATVHTWLTSDHGLQHAGQTELPAYPADAHYGLGDSNGDGLADLGVHEVLADGGNRFSVWRGDGGAFQRWISQDTAWQGLADAQWLAVDADGDRRSDLVVVQRDPSQDAHSSDSSTWLSIRDGGSGGIAGHALGPWARHVALLAGSRGSGRSDLLHIAHDHQGELQVTLWRDDGSGLAAARTSPLGPSRPAQQFLAGDVDGDLRGDIVQLWRDAGGETMATAWRAVAATEGTGYRPLAETNLGRTSGQADWRLRDHDGDGRADLLAGTRGADGKMQVELWLSDGRDFAAEQGRQGDLAWFDADFDGDGRRDLLQISHRADGQTIARQWLATSGAFAEGDAIELGAWRAATRYLSGDLDSDGRSDLTLIRQSADGRVVADTWLTIGDRLSYSARSELGTYPPGGDHRLLDATGDGLADLLLAWQPDEGDSTLTLWQGDGRRFAPRSETSEYGQDLLPATRLSLDLNGDGRSDFASVRRNPWPGAHATDQSTWLSTWQAGDDGSWAVARQGIGIWEQHVALLVVNAAGDGRDDLLRLWQDDRGNLQATVWRSNGASFDDAGTSPLGSADPGQPFHAADVDGDGDSDLVQIGRDPQGRSVATTWRAAQVGERFHYQQQIAVLLGVTGDAINWSLHDHDGDGRADLVGTWDEADGQAQVAVWHADGASFIGRNGWLADIAWFAADFNGDGDDDLFEVGHRGDGMAIGRQWFATGGGLAAGETIELGTWRADTRHLVGDLDADGWSDLCVIGREPDGTVAATFWLSQGDRLLWSGRSVLDNPPAGSDYSLGDADGDGRADLLVHWLPGNGQTRFTLWPSDGSGLQRGISQDGDGEDLAGSLRLSLEMSGDGRSDLAMLQLLPWADAQTSDYSAWLSTWIARDDGSWDVSQQGLGVWAQQVALLAGNADGDGRQDLLRIWRDDQGELQLSRWLSRGGDFAAEETIPLGSSRSGQQFLAADVDHDGRDDLLQIWRDAGDRAVATTWHWDGAGGYRSTDSVLGPWNDDARHLPLRRASGPSDLLRNTVDAGGVATVEVWTYGNGFVLGSRTSLPATTGDPPPLHFVQAAQQAGDPPAATHFQQVLADDDADASQLLPDLVLSDVAITPGANWAAASPVTVAWTTSNQGQAAASGTWREDLEVRNETTGETILRQQIVAGPGPGRSSLGVGESVRRSLSLPWPAGSIGIGNISFRILANPQRTVAEGNPQGTADDNNELVRWIANGPDLIVANLRAQPDSVAAGEELTVLWDDRNAGGVATANDWTDRLQVRNLETGELLADVVLPGDSPPAGQQPLAAGASRQRSHKLRLPDGLRGSGRIEVRIGIDEDLDGQGLLFEANGIGDAETNNRAQVIIASLLTYQPDLLPVSLRVPATAWSGDGIVVEWQVLNQGNTATDQGQWNDRLLLSLDRLPSADDIVLAAAVPHSGTLAAGEGYGGGSTLLLPRDLGGEYFVLLQVDAGGSVDEKAARDPRRLENNLLVSTERLRIDLKPTADLVPGDLVAPATLRPGDVATLRYTLRNTGPAASPTGWWDRIYVDRGAAGGLLEVAAVHHEPGLAAQQGITHDLAITLPGWLADGDYRWLVRSDADDAVHERNAEDNNEAGSPLRVERPDLRIASLLAPQLARSGDRVRVEWQVENRGAFATGDWLDSVHLVQGTNSRLLATLPHQQGLAPGSSYAASAEFVLPLELSGDHQLVVTTDSERRVDDRDRQDNQQAQATRVDQLPWADLAITAISAPQQVIGDPARFTVDWTIANQGTGPGVGSAWSEQVVLSTDDVIGNGDDRVIGEHRQQGLLAAGETASRSLDIVLPAGLSGRYRLFVVADARGEVFENFSEANNAGRVPQAIDLMPRPYADLQVVAVASHGAAASGQPLRVEWEVANRGIGPTDSGDWRDEIWLSRNADGSDRVASFGWAQHIGQLAAGESYRRSLELTLPDGIVGDHYLNVRTGGPFEFIFGDNNRGSSPAVPVTLSNSADLVVDSISLPQSAVEGELADFAWTVVNQGLAAATGAWRDSLRLLPAGGGARRSNSAVSVTTADWQPDRATPAASSFACPHAAKDRIGCRWSATPGRTRKGAGSTSTAAPPATTPRCPPGCSTSACSSGQTCG